MATDKERREVARRLRENAETHPDMNLLLNVAFADDKLRHDGAMEWKVTPRDAAMRLADLIEPPAKLYDSPDSSNSEADEGHEVAIDRDALLALAEDVDEAAAMAVVMDASEGAKMLAEMLLDIARRIREACGEAVA